MFEVSLFITAYFRYPIIQIGFREFPFRAALVAVPEASVNENYFLPPGKDKIRASRQIFGMNSVSITESVNQRSDSKFGSRIFVAHATHDLAASFFR